VKIFRFDPEFSIPISSFGSNFKIAPVTGGDSRVRVQIMHVGPGGLIGRHAAEIKQLFVVVAGSAVVSGGDGKSRDIRSGYAALWEEGEEHDAVSDGGMTAVCVEGEFEVMATRATRDIVVCDYDPEWPVFFEAVRVHTWPAIHDVAIRVDHVGSTSVPGIAAKPIIDMDIVVADQQDVRPVIERLGSIGYRWVGDLGVAGREAFINEGDSNLPDHNLYVVVENNKAHSDHWLLRDLLRQDADSRERYAALKKRNAELANDDIDFYVAAKAHLVAELLTRAREERGLAPETYWLPDPDLSQ